MTPDQRLYLLFAPCESRQELKDHIKFFLKIDLPDATLDEESTSNPMQFVWEIYEMMLTNVGNTAHVAACSRNSAKTLTSAILHFYAMIHFRRSCLQLAATLDQSISCLNYLDKFLSIDDLKSFSEIDNARSKRLQNMPANSVTSKQDAEIRVAVATKKGTNSQRCSFLVCDEVDLTPQEILDEVVFVVDPVAYNQFEPIVVWLSSRKTNAGPIQKLIDDANDPTKEVRLHKWSIADWMKKCPPETHRPDLPRKKAMINLDNLHIVWDETHQKTIKDQFQTNWKEVDSYAGCETCPAFLVCQGRAVRQTSSSKMLRTIKFVGGVLKKVKDTNVIISQYLNLKPETTGIVFKTFSREKHVKDFIRTYQWITGHPFNPYNLSPEEYAEALHSKKFITRQQITPTKDDIYLALESGGWDTSFGVDWGYSPAPATCVVVAFHRKTQRACVFHVEVANGYDNRAWAEYVSTNIWPRFKGNFIAPDMADPASPAYFGKYKIPTINTKPHQIETGVSQLRGLLWNVSSQSSQFVILDDGQTDSGLKQLIQAFEQWTHRRTPLGFHFEKFEDDDHTHVLDALRYALAPYVKEINVSLSARQPASGLMDQYRVSAIQALPPDRRAAAVEALARFELEKFFKENYGLDNVFDSEKRLRDLDEVRKLNSKLSGEPAQPEEEQDLTQRSNKSNVKMLF
jgi:hypothetical protein